MSRINLSGRQKTSAVIAVNKEQGINYKRVLGLAGGKSHARSTLDVTESKGALKITIRAKDATALRASVNSILRDLQIIEAASGRA